MYDSLKLVKFRCTRNCLKYVFLTELSTGGINWTSAQLQHPASVHSTRVRGYHPRKMFENSDAKSCILVITCFEISCFLKTTAKKLGGGEQFIVGLPNLKVGDQSPPVPTAVAPMVSVTA